MKPNSFADRRRRELAQQERQRQAAGEALRSYLEGENELDKVVPELIPTEADRDRAIRDLKRLQRQALGRTRGKDRNRTLDKMVPIVAHLVFVERVLGLDPLVRAGLTPRQMRAITAQVTPKDLDAKIRELNGQRPDTGLVLP